MLLVVISFLCSCGKQDETKPVVTMKGKNPDTLIVKTVTTYNDPGCTAQDDIDGDVTSNIIVSTNVNVNVVSYYLISYSVEDKAGNVSNKLTRRIEVITANGIYDASYNCTATADSVVISSNNTYDTLTISNAYSSGASIKASLSGTTYIIYSQPFLAGTITGTINASGTTLNVSFNLTSPVTSCTATFKKR